jgi:hypothetical protein
MAIPPSLLAKFFFLYTLLPNVGDCPFINWNCTAMFKYRITLVPRFWLIELLSCWSIFYFVIDLSLFIQIFLRTLPEVLVSIFLRVSKPHSFSHSLAQYCVTFFTKDHPTSNIHDDRKSKTFKVLYPVFVLWYLFLFHLPDFFKFFLFSVCVVFSYNLVKFVHANPL